MMADLPTPHDTLFRALISDPERARDFVRDHLPRGLSVRLADTPPEIVEGSFVDEALGFLAEIAESLPAGGDLRRQVLEYVLRVYNVDLEELRTILRDGGHNEMEALVGTIAETLLDQGEARGLDRGRTEGKVETLLRLARIRFGDVPAARDREVRSADAATLDRWLERLVTVGTLDEIFEPRRPR